MTQSNSPSGGKQGILGALSGLGWPVFIIDEILENAPKIVNGIKEGAWGKVLLGLLIILGTLLLSPFLWAFAIPAWLAWSRFDFDLTASLKIGAVGEIIFVALLVAWVIKKVSRDPWLRALIQAQVEHQHDSKLAPGELAKRVREALVEDERACKKADDVVRHLLTHGAERRPWWQRIRINWPFTSDGGRDQDLSCFKIPPRPTGEFSTPRRPDYGVRDPMKEKRR